MKKSFCWAQLRVAFILVLHGTDACKAEELHLKSSPMALKRALVFVAHGTEEIEFTTAVDLLRRVEMSVVTAAVGTSDKHIKGGKGIGIVPDMDVEQAAKGAPYDVLIVPGGMGGTKTMAADSTVAKLLKEQEESGRLVAAICAAPLVLKENGLFKNSKLTSYPSVKGEMESAGHYTYVEHPVVVSGNLVTSRGPGTAIDFALQIIHEVYGTEKADQLAAGILHKRTVATK